MSLAFLTTAMTSILVLVLALVVSTSIVRGIVIHTSNQGQWDWFDMHKVTKSTPGTIFFIKISAPSLCRNVR
jgi:hypothetical protein